MTKILGLDLGTNSIGWAVVDNKDQKIMDSGVRIFPEGVSNLGEGEREESKNAERRGYRQMRRQVARKRIRKIKLLELLIDHGMCPLTHEELKQWGQWKKDKKSAGRGFPESERMTHWLKINPYQVRSKALSENISRMEMGRLLYHMIQRRGFFSSRKEAKDSGAIFTGSDKMVGIDKTRKELNGMTMGQYFWEIYPKEGQPHQNIRDEEGNNIRIRGRYTLRDMYVLEFEKIWQKQAKQLGLDQTYIDKKKVVFLNGSKNRNRNKKRINYLKNNRDNVFVEEVQLERSGSIKTLTKVTSIHKISLHEHLGGTINLDNGHAKFDNKESVMFYQRPLRSQKKLLGKCRFEPTKTPVPTSHPDFEEFRVWQFVNNIQMGIKEFLPLEQKKEVVELLKTKKTAVKFSDVTKALKLTNEKFNYEDDFKASGCQTIAQLTKLFSKEIWEKYYHQIWHDFYFYDDNNRLYEKLKKAYEAKIKSPEELNKIGIKTEEYASLSLKAVKNILPFLKKGYKYNEAVTLGGVMNAFNYGCQEDDTPRWERFGDYHEEIEREVIRIIRNKNKQGEAIKAIQQYLTHENNKFGFEQNDPAFKKLYHHSQEVQEKTKQKYLPSIENLRNPVVQRTMNELRRLVNALVDKHGSLDRINVEMGRDLKLGKTQRSITNTKIKVNLEKNDHAREKLTEFGLAHSRQNIQKVLLFEEIMEKAGKVVCPYSNQSINYHDLLGPENKIQIEHIIPRSISLNDSFSNKTLCDSRFNQMKGDLTPWQFYQKNNNKSLWGADSWDQIERRAYSLLPFPKAKKFTVRRKEWDTEEFISRQLNDSRYISMKAKEILLQICDEVLVMGGGVTADLRRLWGLNNILEPLKGLDKFSSEVDPGRDTSYWAVVDKDNNVNAFYPQNNPKPALAAEEICVPGYVKKQVYESKMLGLKMNTPPELTDGKYYAKIGIEGPLKLEKKYAERPEAGEDEIVLRGLIKNKKFQNDSLQKKPEAPANLDDGSYYARFSVVNKRFIIPEKKRPENKKGICLFGTVKDQVFSSYIYECQTDLDDGKYWALLDLNLDHIQFTPVSQPRPQINSNQVVIIGDVNQEQEYTSIVDPDYRMPVTASPGRYWAVFNITPKPTEYTRMNNPIPQIARGERLAEVKVWVDKNTGEIRYDPQKNRDDHRHHAIDAIAIALTEHIYVNKLNQYNAQIDGRKRNAAIEKPTFPEPWESFRNHVKNSADSILVSHLKNNPVLKKISKSIVKDGKKLHSQGYAVRGQLHKETVFGRRKPQGKEEAFHVRKEVNGLKDNQVKKIVDDRVRDIITRAREKEKLLNKEIENLKKQKRKEDEAGEQRIEEQINELRRQINDAFTLPNRRGEKVPVRKVRIRERLGNTELLKPTKNIQQYVNPRNNHHVLIYKDQEGTLREDVVSLWVAAERMTQGQSPYQLPPDGTEIVSTLEVNDMFVIGAPKELSDKLEKGETNYAELSSYLYRVQKISKMDYTFRHHLASTINDSNTEERIVSFKAWSEKNPVKVKISNMGEIV